MVLPPRLRSTPATVQPTRRTGGRDDGIEGREGGVGRDRVAAVAGGVRRAWTGRVAARGRMAAAAETSPMTSAAVIPRGIMAFMAWHLRVDGDCKEMDACVRPSIASHRGGPRGQAAAPPGRWDGDLRPVTFEILVEAGLMSPGLGRVMVDMTGFRNVIIHEYASDRRRYGDSDSARASGGLSTLRGRSAALAVRERMGVQSA